MSADKVWYDAYTKYIDLIHRNVNLVAIEASADNMPPVVSARIMNGRLLYYFVSTT